MADKLYRLKEPKKDHTANQVPGSHQLRDGRVVTYASPQRFDAKAEGIDQWVEEVPDTGEPKPAQPAGNRIGDTGNKGLAESEGRAPNPVDEGLKGTADTVSGQATTDTEESSTASRTERTSGSHKGRAR